MRGLRRGVGEGAAMAAEMIATRILSLEERCRRRVDRQLEQIAAALDFDAGQSRLRAQLERLRLV